MNKRRHFLKTLTAGSAFVAVSHPFFASSFNNNRKLQNIGYISGIIKEELKGDWKSVLKKTVEYGYSEIETGNYLGDSADSFLSYCKEIGIKPIAGGIKFSENMDEVKKSIEKVKALNVLYGVSYWPWKVGAPFKLEDCKISADILNKIGEACNEYDLELCWHNHDNEFIEMEEGLPFDYLMKHTDKDLVKCEMDIYWVKKGGADPLKVLKKYEGRIPILHVKDMAPGEEQTFSCPGSGIIDFPSIFAEAANQNIQHYFVERDKVVDGMACLESAADYLKSIEF
jgi:sugar phosphate isomerase/epimerase